MPSKVVCQVSISDLCNFLVFVSRESIIPPSSSLLAPSGRFECGVCTYIREKKICRLPESPKWVDKPRWNANCVHASPGRQNPLIKDFSKHLQPSEPFQTSCFNPSYDTFVGRSLPGMTASFRCTLEGAFPWLASERKARRNSGQVWPLHGLLLIQIWTTEVSGTGGELSRDSRNLAEIIQQPPFFQKFSRTSGYNLQRVFI